MKQSLLSVLGILCALCVLGVLCVNATAQQGVANPFQGNAQAVAEGREIYNRTCTTCHGADGAGSEMGPALGAPARRYALATDAQIVDAIENGIPTTQMPRFGGGRLADDAIWKLTAYNRGLRGIAIDAPARGDAALGEQSEARASTAAATW